MRGLSLIFSLLLLISCSKKDAVNTPVTEDTTGTDTDTIMVPAQVAIAVVDSQVNVLMAKYSVPALSIAITKGGKLVYVKAYGLADKEKNQKADTGDLYRLASLS